MSDIAIRVENLTKRYRIGAQPPYYRFSEVLQSLPRMAIDAPRRWWQDHRKTAADRTHQADGYFWALKGVSFEVREGEAIGIVGRNGAGKSTLLKILSRITEQTSGRLGFKGRVGSLLEVGTGFHQELTGRENVYLSGTILGMNRAEINSFFDQIVAFADIGQFLDTPVKRYSSGMRVRLGFAVAAHLRPEILIVDEVLAVGDGDFRAKCLAMMGQIAASGRTVLFVSHNSSGIRQLCSRVLWLRDGQCVADGPSEQVIDSYLASLGTQDAKNDLAYLPRPGDLGSRARIASCHFANAGIEATPRVRLGEAFSLAIQATCHSRIEALSLVVGISAADGTGIATCLSDDTSDLGCMQADDTRRVEVAFRDLPLNIGKYKISVSAFDRRECLDRVENCLEFRVVEPADTRPKLPAAVTQGHLRWQGDWKVGEASQARRAG